MRRPKECGVLRIQKFVPLADELPREGRNILDHSLRKNILKGDRIRAFVKDDRVPMMNEKGAGRREIAGLDIRKGIIKELVLARRRRGVKRGDLENESNALADGRSARGALVVGGVRGCGHRLAGSEAKGRIDDDSKDDRARDTDRRGVGVGSDRCQRARGEGDNGDDDGSLSYRLSFDLKNELHGRGR